jgi:hypothetical protein
MSGSGVSFVQACPDPDPNVRDLSRANSSVTLSV